ncbi:ABC transporter permease [Rhodobacter sp. 24-YEA-8]|uniref:ABC transporter permease n=1 Tax=Rhodobacter sp. 24-YEA-8 TaxID=1884310 RepID=UPI000894F7CC|nr:ABC transporter permease [Rhodobacter sp. 24-YEA-8]SED84706.1 peptide/nickel transport system permease protein [Rhodobacter sp. 24-YEA-8]
MQILQFTFMRMLSAIPVLIGVTIIVFLAVQLVPGDIALSILGRMASQEQLQALREQMGLDRSLVVQYGIWFTALLQGDIGTSLSQQLPVAGILGPKIINSLILMAGSLFIVLVFGFLLAVLSGAKFRSITDRVVVVITLVLASLPAFWLGIIMLYFFGFKWKLFPISGMYNVASPGGFWDLIHHLILPAAVTAAGSVAVVARVTRSRMIDVMAQPYILAGKARGLKQSQLVLRHAVRNTLPTFASIGGLQIGYLFGGVIFTEIIFNWPGIGLQVYDAILQRDIPMIQGCVLVVAVVFVIGNLLSDIAVYALDPKKG